MAEVETITASPREAGFLAFAVQLFAFAQALFLAASRALLPVLAELESRGDARRLARWGGLMMRWATLMPSPTKAFSTT